MKHSLLLRLAAFAAFFQFANQTLGQDQKPWGVRRAYLNASGSSTGSGTVQFNLHFNNRWVAFIGHTEGNTDSKNLPMDYSPGTFDFGNETFIKSGNPQDMFQMVTAGVGKVLTPNSDKAWIMGLGGITIGNYQETIYTRQEVEYYSFFGLFGGTNSNYAKTTQKNTLIGISTGIEGHVNIARIVGFATGVRVALTNQGIFPSFNMGMNIGLMRPSKKNMYRAGK